MLSQYQKAKLFADVDKVRKLVIDEQDNYGQGVEVSLLPIKSTNGSGILKQRVRACITSRNDDHYFLTTVEPVKIVSPESYIIIRDAVMDAGAKLCVERYFNTGIEYVGWMGNIGNVTFRGLAHRAISEPDPLEFLDHVKLYYAVLSEFITPGLVGIKGAKDISVSVGHGSESSFIDFSSEHTGRNLRVSVSMHNVELQTSGGSIEYDLGDPKSLIHTKARISKTVPWLIDQWNKLPKEYRERD